MTSMHVSDPSADPAAAVGLGYAESLKHLTSDESHALAIPMLKACSVSRSNFGNTRLVLELGTLKTVCAYSFVV